MSNETRENGKGGRHLKAAPETPSANERPVKKKRHVGRTVIIVIAALIVAVLLAAFLIFHDLYSLSLIHILRTPLPWRRSGRTPGWTSV